MRRWICVCIVLLLLAIGVNAQDESSNLVKVIVESLIIRTQPSEEAPMGASAFRDDLLEPVGRNLTGQWLQVRRPGRLVPLGWVYEQMVKFPAGLRVEKLPLTDLTTGLEGPTPLAADTGFAAYMNEGATMRDQPFGYGNRIIGIPLDVIVVVLERDSHSQWLRVNYIGYEGWISALTVRRVPNLAAVPVSSVRDPKQIDILVIPPEIQLAQLQRMRDYIQPQLDLAINLEWFWGSIINGDIQPCTPPPFSLEFGYSREDLRELPEIGRYAPRINQATTAMNASLAAFQRCGVLSVDDTYEAQANAINAKIIYRAALDAIDDTEKLVR